jgi:hypothetical protein
MIDPATGWFEIQQYYDKQSITVANILEQEWFSRYPWPTQVTFVRGSKLIGQDFQKMEMAKLSIQLLVFGDHAICMINTSIPIFGELVDCLQLSLFQFSITKLSS